MAKVVLGLGTSHSPLVVTNASMWEARAASDRHATDLIDRDGRIRTYAEIASTAGDRYMRAATLEHFREQSAAVQRALDRLAAEMEQARPDVVAIVGDDHHELYSPASMPAIAIHYGNKVVTYKYPERPGVDPSFMRAMSAGYAMDRHHEFDCDAGLAREIIERMVAGGVDVSASAEVPEPEKAGFGHAFGFVVTRLMARWRVPIIPISLNTYYPPNQPTPSRCYDMGIALRAAIEASGANARVAIVASGGLSHFVTNEELDGVVLG
ncbi:MAG: hypothetical protein ACREQN_02860, partial [Candidatus Binataceae bacterium]